MSLTDDLDDEYGGFVPDYTFEDDLEPDEDLPEFILEKKKRFAERQAKEIEEQARQNKEMVRKNNLEKSFGKGKIVFEDTDELDNYAGFVPDYSPNSTNNDEFDYYKPRSVTSYSKYKKGGKTSAGYVVPSRVKQINQDEVAEIFTKTTLKVKKPSSANEVNASYYLCSFSGKQIATLLNSWLIMNFTHLSVKEFEKKEIGRAHV